MSLIPIVDQGSLVGCLSRHGLIRALRTDPAEPGAPTDADLVALMQQRMADESGWVPGPRPAVHARGGILELWGLVGTEPQKAALETMARAIPGCRDVDSHLAVMPTRGQGVL